MLAWGGGNTLIASIGLPGLTVAFLRTLFAVAIYVPVLYLRGGRLSLDSFRYGWNGGVAFGADVATFFVALSLTTVANATTISALQPLVIMAFAAAVFGERVRMLQVACAVVATAGVSMVAFGAAAGGANSVGGDLVAVLALFAWSWYFIASKRARTRLDTFEYMTVMNVVALLVIAPFAAIAGDLAPIPGDLEAVHLVSVLALVLIPGSGHILANWAHNHTTLVTMSLITLAMPVISTVTAAVFLDQRVAVVQGVGIAVVLVALAISVLFGERQGSPLTLADQNGGGAGVRRRA